MKLLDKLVLKDLIPMFGVGIGMFSSLWFAGGPILEASKYLSQGFAVMIVLHLLILGTSLHRDPGVYVSDGDAALGVA